MLVADKEHPAASHILESQAGWASSLCPHSAAVSGSVMLYLIAFLPSLAHLPSTIHRYWGKCGEQMASHSGRGRWVNTPAGLLLSSPEAALSPPVWRWLPREGGLQQQWCFTTKGIAFPSGAGIWRGTELSPSAQDWLQPQPTWWEVAARPGSSCKMYPFQPLPVLKRHPGSAWMCRGASHLGLQALPLQHIIFFLLKRQQFSGFYRKMNRIMANFRCISL